MVPVALSIMDPDNPYRYVQIRGKVTSETEEGARAHIDTLSHKYLGKDYPFAKPEDVRLPKIVDAPLCQVEITGPDRRYLRRAKLQIAVAQNAAVYNCGTGQRAVIDLARDRLVVDRGA